MDNLPHIVYRLTIIFYCTHSQSVYNSICSTWLLMFCRFCLHSSLWFVQSSVCLRSSLRQPRYLYSETRWVNGALFFILALLYKDCNEWRGSYYLCIWELAWNEEWGFFFNVVMFLYQLFFLLVLIKNLKRLVWSNFIWFTLSSHLHLNSALYNTECFQSSFIVIKRKLMIQWCKQNSILL